MTIHPIMVGMRVWVGKLRLSTSRAIDSVIFILEYLSVYEKGIRVTGK